MLDRRAAGDYEPQARDQLEVNTFAKQDLEGMARIDRRLTGRDRRGHLCRGFGVEPVAVIDAVGVDPLRARQGVGRGLLSQLFANLAALGVERVETVVAPGNLDLMGFFYRAGFKPSERLSFLKRLS